VKAAAKKYLDTKQYFESVMLPEAGAPATSPKTPPAPPAQAPKKP
jgi:hypothetical protein